MKFRDAVKMIESDGWRLNSVRGSHYQFKHPTKPGKVTIKRHGGNSLDDTTVRSIKKQAGLK